MTQRRELALRIGMFVIGAQPPVLPRDEERWKAIRIANAAPAAVWHVSLPQWKWIDWFGMGAI